MVKIFKTAVAAIVPMATLIGYTTLTLTAFVLLIELVTILFSSLGLALTLYLLFN